MYGLAHLKAALKRPERIVIEVGRIQHRIDPRHSNDEGECFVNQEWDVLVLLDACRYDFFVERCSLPGETGYKYSLGSNSPEFIKENFSGRESLDTIVVTANPWYRKLQSEHEFRFFDLIYVEGDPDRIGVRPETLTDRALAVDENHPDKRLVLHYMQPHQPYMGPTGEAIEHCGPTDVTLLENNVDDDTLRSAYAENLDLVLDEIERVFENVPGRIVVTADHGELLGERPYFLPVRDFGHPRGVYSDELVKVPWHVYENGDRDVRASRAPKETTEPDVEEDLKALGYKL